MKEISTLEEFNQVISSDSKVVVKFYTTWCPDCTRMDMFIGEIMENHKDLEWYQFNKDNFPEVAEKYDVMGIPSLLLFENNEKIGHLHSANAKTPEQVEEFLANY